MTGDCIDWLIKSQTMAQRLLTVIPHEFTGGGSNNQVVKATSGEHSMFYMIIKNNRVTKVVRDDKHSEEDFYQALDRCKRSRESQGVTYELVTGHMEMLADYAEQQQDVVDRVEQLATEILDYSREIIDIAGVDDDD